MQPPPSSTLFPYTTLFRSYRHFCWREARHVRGCPEIVLVRVQIVRGRFQPRSEEHTSELQSRRDLVCRLLLEKKKVEHGNDDAQLQQHAQTSRYAIQR